MPGLLSVTWNTNILPLVGSFSAGSTKAVPTTKKVPLVSPPSAHDAMLTAFSLGHSWYAWRTVGVWHVCVCVCVCVRACVHV